MSNSILFKKGSYNDFKTNVLASGKKAIPGALYLTEDDGGLYIGKSDQTVQRIQGSVVFWPNITEFGEKVTPPYSEDVIYFLVEQNSLIRWDGTNGKWIILNQTAAAAEAAIEALNARCDQMVLRAGDTMTGFLSLHADPTENMHAATKQYVDAAKTAANNYADGLIAANDAMVFKGVVNATNDLPTDGVQCGWTYKVGTATEFTLAGTKVAAKIGDLLINKGADNAPPVWEHVSSGYESQYLQKLKLADNQIHITNGVDDDFKSDLGAFKFVADSGTNLSFSNKEEGGVITVTASMTWGSFSDSTSDNTSGGTEGQS